MGFRDKNMAETGKSLITSTATTGNWWRIFALADTVFLSLTDGLCDTWDAGIGSITLKQGDFIDGAFTRVALTSGSVMCYKAGKTVS